MSKMSLIPLAYVCIYSDLLRGFGGLFHVRLLAGRPPSAHPPPDTGGARSYCLIVPLRRWCEAAALPAFTARLRSQRTLLEVRFINGCHNNESKP